MATEIAAAYISLIPSTQNIASSIGASLGAPVASAAAQSGAAASASFAGTFAAGAAAAGVAAVAAAGAAGVGLAALGGTFDEAFDTIRIGTGATGDALGGLKDDFKAVFSSVPTSAGDASTAIADLNTRLGLSGKPLQDMATQFLELSRLTGTDLQTNIANLTRMFGDWGIAGEDQTVALDKVFRASQATGIGIDQLSQQVVQFGTPMRQLGFSFEEGLALFSQFEKEGVVTENTMSGLNRAVTRLAEQGVPFEEAFDQIVGSIKNAPTEMEAVNRAAEVFGTRGAANMAGAIREGRFEIDELLGVIEGGSDTILGAAEDTESWGEKWNVIKNRVLTALEPVATRVFDAIGDGLDYIAPIAERVFGFLSSLGDTFREDGFEAAVGRFGDAIAAAWPAVQARLQELGASLWDWIGDNLPPALEQLGLWIGGVLDWLVTTGAPAFRQWMRDTFAPGLWDWVKTSAGPLLADLGVLLGRLVSWIVTDAVPVLVQQGAMMTEAFWGWITNTAVPWLQENLPIMWDAYVAWVTQTAWPWLAENVPQWLQAMWGWILTVAVPWIGQALMGISRAISEWFYLTFIPWLVTNYPQWAAAFTEWITTTAIPWLLTKLVELQTAFGTWITDTALPWLRTKAGEWAAALVDWITTEGIPAARTKLGEWLGDVQSWAAGLPGQFRDMLISAGTDLVAGLWEGITDRWDGLVEDLAGLVDQLPGVVKDVLGIASPSKVMMELGADTARGFALGIEKVAPSAEVATYQAARFAADGVRSRQSGFRPLSRAGRQPVQLMVNEDVLATTTIDSLRTRERAGQ